MSTRRVAHAPQPLSDDTKRTLLRFSKGHFKLAALTLVVELSIALWARDEYVRPLLGDALVVVLMYAALLSVFDLSRIGVALGVFLFACSVEVAQYLQIVHVLGLEHIPLASVVIGTSFDPRDFLAYGAGALALVLAQPRRP